MSNPHLLPEILDYIADLLHRDSKTLNECCLVSKSWIPRTRKHLFAKVEFDHEDDLGSWKTFPDPSNSPGYHTRTLKIGCTQVVRAADAEVGGWIQAFSRVASFDLSVQVNPHPTDLVASLALFYKLSPTLKSLRMHVVFLPYPGLFTLIRSSPFSRT